MATIIQQKRFTNELKMLLNEPLHYTTAYPDANDSLIWYFLIRGQIDTQYYGGDFIGKIVHSKKYPVEPPAYYMLTPNGRFEIERKICLTITSYHSDQWSSIWSIQKILGAFLSVMVSDFDTGISHIKKTASERNKFATDSFAYNINMYPDILKNFPRFVKYENKIFTMKTFDEIKAEMPKPKTVKSKKRKEGDTKEETKQEEKLDLSMLKITDN